MKVDYREFLHSEEVSSNTRNSLEILIAGCVAQNLPLVCELLPPYASISSESDLDSTTDVSLTGEWTTPQARLVKLNTKSSTLAASLLFLPTKLHFNPSAICTYKCDYGSIADYFARNLFGAVCRGRRTKFTSADRHLLSDGYQNRLEFSKRYWWLVQSRLGETEIPSRNTAAMLVVNAHIDVLDFKSPMLHRGFAHFREAGTGIRGLDHALRNFSNTRDELLELVA